MTPVFIAQIGLTLFVFVMLLTSAAGMVYFERKVAALLQQRMGPYLVGPKGLLQPLADVIKLMFKEELRPRAADALLFALAGVLVLANSLSLADIVAHQSGAWLGFIPRWYVFFQPLGFLIFMIAGVAETNRAPFDFPEAEQELVAGYHTEYSSMRFAMFFLAEYINMVTVSAVATDLFLGGWHGPLLPESLGWIWFLVKVAAILFFYVWMRWTLPRYRYDQLMRFGWKVLLPVAAVNLLATAAGVLYFRI